MLHLALTIQVDSTQEPNFDGNELVDSAQWAWRLALPIFIRCSQNSSTECATVVPSRVPMNILRNFSYLRWTTWPDRFTLSPGVLVQIQIFALRNQSFSVEEYNFRNELNTFTVLESFLYELFLISVESIAFVVELSFPSVSVYPCVQIEHKAG